MNKESFNADNLVGQINANKDSIDNHPIDQLDILIAECNPENCGKTIETIKKIVGEHPELTGEFLEQIENQRGYAKLNREKAQKIEDRETRLDESIKLDNKLRALAKLSRSIDRRSKDRDGDGK